VLWGWAVDKQRPDIGDAVGASIAITGALIMFFWPRKT
jgi:drug/metabolite transporter superfamily protein YnfA